MGSSTCMADCLEVACCLSKEDSSMPGNALIVVIKELLRRDWQVQIRYIGRVSDTLADRLTSMGRGQPLGETTSDVPPIQVMEMLQHDPQHSDAVD
ncbi:hypothetical protein GQ457_07G024240 [Hibiscus cannabinus]